MKKIALFALALCMLGTNFAWGQCFLEVGIPSNPWKYVIYFKTGADTNNDCDPNEGAEVAQKIQAEAAGDIWFLASADTQGRNNGYDNERLAKRRLEWVKGQLGITPAQAFVAGDTAAWAGGSTGPDSDYRAVYILYVKKNSDEQLPTPELEWIDVTERVTMDITVDTKYTTKGGEPENIVSQLVSDISGLRANLDVSKWKDKNGNFNTSRLLSDSIAGVVLGTAGGLITSNVIKKNQVSGGFDGIHCTIGGQVVADWGDEFVVGMR